MTQYQAKRKTANVSLIFLSRFLSLLPPSSSPSAPGGLCLDRIEFSRANMGKAPSRLCMVNVSVERVISLALPATPTYSLASGSQSADLCCWGDLVFHVGYLKSTNTSLPLSVSLFYSLTFSLSRALALLQPHNILLTHSPVLLSALPSPIPLLFNLLPPGSFATFIPFTVSLCESSTSFPQHLLVGYAQFELTLSYGGIGIELCPV